MELVLRAANLAAAAHASQRRKGLDEPYINHPLRVALAAHECGLGPEAIAAALMHDVVEDTATGIEVLERQFSPRVVELVRLLTKWWPDDAPAELKKTENPKYYGAILADPEAVEIKLLDRADNLGDMRRMLPKASRWAARYLAKTRKEFAPIVVASRNDAVKRRFEDAVNALSNALEALPS